MIECTGTGLVFRNPQPYLRAVHAWHPSLASLEDGRLICAFDLGQAPESLDYRTYVAHSTDNGFTWESPVRLFGEPFSSRPSTHTVRIHALRDGQIVGLGARFYRDDPNEGLTNRATLGFVPMDLIQLSSRDGGRSWSAPTTIDPPLIGPAFEICHAVVELADGRWLAPTQTLPDWNGAAPNGIKAVALVSGDKGRTWPDVIDVFDGADGLIHYEQSLVQLADGRLLAIAWAYDAKMQETLSTPYAISRDGRAFGLPKPTGLRGQTAKLLALADGRVLTVYRRDDRPGLWANVSRMDGETWINLGEQLLWDGPSRGFGTNTSDMLSSLSFGYPSLAQFRNGEILVVFWCEEQKVQVIRWFRLVIGSVQKKGD